VANPLGIFFSRLAPDDKKFVKKIGISLLVLLVLSGLAWYLFATFGTMEIKKPQKIEQPAIFEMPPGPEEVPGIDDFSHHVAHEQAAEPVGDKFDEQAHLQLMRQNASKYNYKQAYLHGARITGSLLADKELIAEWGKVLLEAGKPKDAVFVLQKIALEDTVKSDVSIDMAFAMFYSGNADGAIEFLDSKMQNNSDSDLLAAKASIIGNNPDAKRSAAADTIFLKCMKSGNVSPRANYWHGRYLMERGDYKNSKAYLEKAVKAKPNEPRYIARLGMAEFYLKQDSNAEALYKKALNTNPYDYNTWFNLGELYLSKANESIVREDILRKTKQALEAYSMTIKNDSLHAKAHYRIGHILNWNGQHKEAIKHLSIALENMSGNIPVMQQLSAAYIKVGDTARAIGYLDVILQIDPFNKVAAEEFNRIRGKR